MTERKPAYRKLRTAKELQRLMQRHYLEGRYLRLGRPVAWVTSGAPVEPLRAMGVLPIYPENYGALCGAQRVAVTLCQAAEERGYSLDLCSYARSHLGSVFDPKKAPMSGLPKPDLLICCGNICDTVIKWYQALAEHYGIPLFVLDTPFVYGEAPDEAAVAYVQEQLEDMVAFLERHTRRRLRLSRLEEVVGLSREATRLWTEIRMACKARPSPLNAPDLFVNMAPIVVLRGTPEAVRFYQNLKAEVEERVEQGIGAVPDERYRLLWDNIAIWYRLYGFYRIFSEQGACFVVDTYTGAWSADLQPGDLFTSMARTYTGVLLNQGVGPRARHMVNLAREFQVDGFVMHLNRSCKPYSLPQLEIKRIVQEETGLPGLLLEADHTDSRVYAEEPIRTRVQAFLETLAARSEAV
ncbi:MAG: 2-hydroxyacyl-CoA dehydratase subunit D [Anaerolineae bacterium]